MQISLRSQMIAGTAAIVGASAIAMTPVVAQHATLPDIQVPSASSMEVALAGFDSPITELIGTIGLTGKYLFDPTAASPGGPLPLPNVGWLPQFITGALPVIRQLGLDGTDYITTSLGGVLASAGITSEVLWNLPGTVVQAGQLVLAGQAQAAIALVQNTVVAPLIQAGKDVLNALAYPIQYSIARAIKVANALISTASNLVAVTVGQLQAVTNSVVGVVTNAINAGSVEGAWNAVVDGFFGPGPGSVPNTLLNLTIGGGIGALPSVRAELWGAGQTIIGALVTTPQPTPPFAAKPVAAKPASSVSPSALRAPAKAVAAEAPSVTAGDNSATPGDNNNGGSSGGGSSNGGGSHSKGTGHSKR